MSTSVTSRPHSLTSGQFVRYSFEHVQRRGRSGTLDDGWWSGTTEAMVNGEEVIMKTYEGPQGVKVRVFTEDVGIG
jgi:hypothetical protein